MKLGDMAKVRSGLVLSRKQARETSGIRYSLLNLRSVNPGGFIDAGQLDVFDATEQLSQEYLSQAGDVIIRLSSPYTAILIDETTSGIVVSSNFVIVRTDGKTVLPEYLLWLINTQKIKRMIYENTGSNMLGAIKAKFFTEFEIPPISLEEQKRIADINLLAIKEIRQLRKLAEEKERYYSLMLEQIHTEMKRSKKNENDNKKRH